MRPDSPKDRRAAMALMVALALYVLLYLTCRAGGALTLRPPRTAAGWPTASLSLPPLTFHSACPPLLRVFWPTLWLESRLAARLRAAPPGAPAPGPDNHESRADDQFQQ